MMMPSWLARPLRRLAGTVVMLIGGQAALHAIVYPGPNLPPADTDRVGVTGADGLPHDITDPASVERITAFVRARRDPFEVVHNIRAHFWHTPRACFHRGAAIELCIAYHARVMHIPTRSGDYLLYRLTPAEAAEFQRLVEEGIAASGP